jgi:superfamily II RNA helicase
MTTITESTMISKYLNQYPFELSSWQKQAVQAILDGHNVIVMAPTGSGKTLPAEIAIRHLTRINNTTERNKIVYCSPIKALTNEKKDVFTKKFKGQIEIGVRTGDITYNENSDLLLCTTEILRNNIARLKKNTNILDFKMNPEKELAAVIFDEIHNLYYNKQRGTVWEEAIMDLPTTTQIIGLSATLNNPQKLCNTLTKMNGKKTVLCASYKRIVPLEHHLLYFIPNNITKKLNGKVKDEVQNYPETNCILLKDSDKFYEESYEKFVKLDKLIFNNKPKHLQTKSEYLINKTAEYLHKNDKLPSIIYVMSRKRCFDYAYCVTTPILEENSKIPHTIEKIAKQMLIEKISNWKEYVELPEWKFMMDLLKKGCAVHHSGVMPVIREVVEKLFKQKYIKIVFATESMGIGVDFPVKSTVHTSIQKFTNGKHQYFRPDEYNQMAGRAGRRGQDIKGDSYLLLNLFYKNPIINSNNFSFLLSGKAQPMYSQFQFNCDLILKLLYQDYSKEDIVKYLKKSIYYEEILGEYIETKKTIEEHVKKYITPKKINEETSELSSTNDIILKKLNDKAKNLMNYIDLELANHIAILDGEGFVENNKLTLKGEMACILQEMPALSIATFILSLKSSNKLKYITARQWISFLAIFTPIRLSEEDRITKPEHIQIDTNVIDMIKKFDKTLEWFYKLEIEFLKSGKNEKYKIHYDMSEFLYNWSEKKGDLQSDVYHCKKIIKDLEYWGISLGDFIKAINKINSIVKELEKVASIMEDLDFLTTIKEIPALLLKYVVTNDSLYI